MGGSLTHNTRGFEDPGSKGFVSATTKNLPTPDRGARLVRPWKPAYPKHLAHTGIEGDVRLRVLVERNGRAGEVELVSGVHPELDALAIRSLDRFRWRPARRDGEAVRTWVVIVIRFTIDD